MDLIDHSKYMRSAKDVCHLDLREIIYGTFDGIINDIMKRLTKQA